MCACLSPVRPLASNALTEADRGAGNKEPKSVKQEDEERAVQLGYGEGKVCRGRWGKVLLLGGKGREVLTMLGLGDQRRRFSCSLRSLRVLALLNETYLIKYR